MFIFHHDDKFTFSDVQDIDLFIGSIAEEPLADALVGPTNACILGRQFHDLKAGDRFWYETGNQKTSFTKGNNCQKSRAK